MSWIFGYAGQNSRAHAQKLSKAHQKTGIVFLTDTFYLAAAENKNLHSSGINDQQDKGWLVNGVGIKRVPAQFRFANNNDWDELFLDSTSVIMNGHFVGIGWNSKNLQIITDILGLRDIYLIPALGGFIFSTRIDFLANIVDVTINFSRFGSRWLTYNQISPESVFQGINRITSGQKAVINYSSNTMKITEPGNREPELKQIFSEQEYSNILNELVSFPQKYNLNLSLSLSGGMDSRVLLSTLLKMNNNSWDAHTFGDVEHPDSIIARNICSQNNIQHHQLNNTLNNKDELLNLLYNYNAQSIVNNPASAIIQIKNFSLLQDYKRIIIDGGFGEIWRGEFLFKLRLYGRKAIRGKNIEQIFKHLQLYRANIFTDEINNKMTAGAFDQISHLIEALPKVEDIGIDSWLDMLAVKTRLPNYYGPEQAYLDNFVTGFMPFVQPVLLDLLPHISQKLRKNGLLFKKVIAENSSQLAKFPLAKGNVINPFNLTSLQSRFFTAIKKKFGKNVYTNNDDSLFFNQLKDFINDTILSKNVKECGIYDYNRIKEMANNYYNGDNNLKNELDWWLAFEIFRQSLNGQNK